MNKTISRRALISAALTLVVGDAFAGRRDRDRGIGGTGAPGAVIEPTNGDRGIGGTGVIGTIRKFGSIIVNDMRIAYPASVDVEIDGRSATAADLRIGQVVQTVARTDGDGLVTRRIVVTSEVVGPIEGMANGRLIVLGQQVATDFVEARNLRKGQWIAVSGLRDLNGVVHASHIQRRDDSLAQVAGPVKVKKGVARIGGLSLVNLNPALAGRRVLASVGRIDGKPAVIAVTPDPERVALPKVRQFSIETYVARRGGELCMGSGLTAAAPSQSLSTAQTRAVLAVTVAPDGGLTATTQRPVADPETTTPTDGAPRQGGASKPAHQDAGHEKAKGHEGHAVKTRADDHRSTSHDSASPSASSRSLDAWYGRDSGSGAPQTSHPMPQTHVEQPVNPFDPFRHNGHGGKHGRH